MQFDLVSNIESCYSYIQTQSAFLNLVYYSHIPSAIISLLVGFYVYFKDKKSLISRILLGLTISFSLWSFLDVIIWSYSYKSEATMFFWSLLGIFESLFFILSLYFVYVFIDKRDMPFHIKILSGLLILPIIILTPTNYNLTLFDIPNCEAGEHDLFLNYLFLIEIIISLWIIGWSIYKYRKAEKEFKKQIILLTIGVTLFLLSFFTTGYIADLAEEYKFEVYGLFGMVIFMGFLAYLIVRYQAFNIKLMAVQALVIAIVLLVGSQFFFIRSNTNRILTGITLVLSATGGVMLIRSVRLEVQRKEELQMMTEKLAAANDQLRKLDNAKSEFISIASHQLRTPLTAVKGFLSLLLEGSYGRVAAKPKEVLNKVYQSNERLIMLVEDLLNLSRIESGRMEYKYESIHIEEVCQEVYDTFVIRAKEKNLSLNLELPEEPLPEVTVDRNKIREIISNLVDNALKYTVQGGVAVSMNISGGQKFQVRVKDTGIGVPKEELPYIFAKFSRGKDPSRLSAGGTGIGLHVGKRMAEDMGGCLFVESEGEGKGSTFILELPVEHIEKE